MLMFRNLIFSIFITLVLLSLSLPIVHGAVPVVEHYHDVCLKLLGSVQSADREIGSGLAALENGKEYRSQKYSQIEDKLNHIEKQIVTLTMAVEDLDIWYRESGKRPSHWENLRTHILRAVQTYSEGDPFGQLDNAVSVINGGVRRVDQDGLRELQQHLSRLIRAGDGDAGRGQIGFGIKPLADPVDPVVHRPSKMMSARSVSREIGRRSSTGGSTGRNDPWLQVDDPAILRKAWELNWEPLTIFNYVRNTIAFDPYPGFRKQPVTLINGGAANGWDTAALTISLLRASGVTCKFACATVELPIKPALEWLGYPCPDLPADPSDAAWAEINDRAFNAESYLNSSCPMTGQAYCTPVLLEGSANIHWLRLRDHPFVVVHLDYVPTRGARRSPFNTPFPEPTIGYDPDTGVPWTPAVPAYPPPEYDGADTWIPLDPCFRPMETVAAQHENPLHDLDLPAILESDFLAQPIAADPAEILLEKYLEKVETLPNVSPFTSTHNAKPRYEVLTYLPNSLPYDLCGEPPLEIIPPESESTVLFNPDTTLKIVVAVSVDQLIDFSEYGTSGGEDGPYLGTGIVQRFDLASLASNRLTFRFVPETPGDIGEDEHMYQVPGLQVLPELVLDGTPTAWESGSLQPCSLGTETWMYLSVQDTRGDWYASENRVTAGEFFSIVLAAQTMNPGQELDLVDEFNTGMMSECASGSGGEDGLSKLLDGQFNEEYLGRYLQLQGRHYFKQLQMSEDILMALFRGRMVRDAGIVRVGMTFDSITMEDEVVSIHGVASFCDVDHYLMNAVLENTDDEDDFYEYHGLASSTGEHELFFRETQNHNGLISTVKVFQRANETGAVFYDTSDGFTGDFNASHFGDSPGSEVNYSQLRGDLAAKLNTHRRKGLNVEVPNSLFEFEVPVDGGGGSKWVGTGYILSKPGHTGYMIFGSLCDAEDPEVVFSRETAGALGLSGEPKFFDQMFGMELEAFIIQQTNLSRSTRSEFFDVAWQDEFNHWITLGMVKEFRWTFRPYSYKAHHYRVLCADRECIIGRPWIRALVWNGPGSLDETADYLVAVFRDDDSPVECINLYNKEYNILYNHQPSAPRPEPRSTGEFEIKWFDYNPWNYTGWEASNLPSWNFELPLRFFSANPWFAAFFGCNTASSLLYKSVSPAVWEHYRTPRPPSTPPFSPTPSPTITPTPSPPPTSIPSQPTYTPTMIPTITMTPSPSPTPSPYATMDLVIGENHCDGFLAAYGNNPLQFEEPEYVERMRFVKNITRGGMSIAEALEADDVFIKYDPVNWYSEGSEGDLGSLLFGPEYRIDAYFQGWGFGTDYSDDVPDYWVHLMDTPSKCSAFHIVGYTTMCLDPDDHGRCPLPETLVRFDWAPYEGEFSGEYQYIGEVVSKLVTVDNPEGTPVHRAYFDFDTRGRMGAYRFTAVHKDAEDRIDYTLDGSIPPESLAFSGTIIVSEDDQFIPVPAWHVQGEDPQEEVPLADYRSVCSEPDGEYPGDNSYVPPHYRLKGSSGHPFYGFGAGDSVDIFSGKLHMTHPLLAFPGDGGLGVGLTLVNSSSIYPHVNEGPAELWHAAGWMGCGWELHLGKVVIERGELPVLTLPDGSSRVMVFEDPDGGAEAFDFHGPYRSADLWKLSFTGIDDIHDDDVNAVFTSPGGVTYTCDLKVENTYGTCPYEDCDNYSYTWLTTAITAPGCNGTVTVEYETYSDEYLRTETDDPVERKLWYMNKITYPFQESQEITFEMRNDFTDDGEAVDIPDVLDCIKHNETKLISFQYEESLSGDRLLLTHIDRARHTDSETPGLITEFDYYPGQGAPDRLDRWRGVISHMTVPEGGTVEYLYGARSFPVRVYEDGAVQYSVEHEDLVLDRRIAETAAGRELGFERVQRVTGVIIPGYRDPETLNISEIIETERRLSGAGGTAEKRLFHGRYQCVNSVDNPEPQAEPIMGLLLKQWVMDGGNIKSATINTGFHTTELASSMAVHPCVNFPAIVCVPNEVLDIVYGGVSADVYPPDPMQEEDYFTRTVMDYPTGQVPLYLNLLPDRVTVSEMTGSLVSKTEFVYAVFQLEYSEFLGSNILTPVTEIRAYSDAGTFQTHAFIYGLDSSTGSYGKPVTTYLNESDQYRTQYGYTDDGNADYIIRPDGEIHDFLWSIGPSSREYTFKSDPDSSWDFLTKTVVNARGDLIQSVDVNEQITDFNSDLVGRVTRIAPPIYTPVEIIYTSPSETHVSIGELESFSFRDGFGRGIHSESPGDIRAHSRTGYDALGRSLYASVVHGEGGLGPKSPFSENTKGYARVESRDALGRVTRMFDASGNLSSASYNLNTVTIVDGEKARKTYIQDAAGRLTGVTMPIPGDRGDHLTEYTYDMLGNLKVVRQGIANTAQYQEHRFQYDSYGRLVKETHPDAGKTTYEYWDQTGRLHRMTQPDGASVVFAETDYDSLGRLKAQTYLNPDESVEKVRRFFYDGEDIDDLPANLAGVISYANATGRQTGITVTTGEGVLESLLIWPKYDAVGNLQEKVLHIPDDNPVNLRVILTHDPEYGRVSDIQLEDQLETGSPRILSRVHYGYDNSAGTLESVTLNSAESAILLANTMHHTAAGALEYIELGNGIPITQLFDPANLLTDICHGDCNNPIAGFVGFTYNNVNHITDITVNGESDSFEYDAWHRLISADVAGINHQYQYDVFNNMTGRAVGDGDPQSFEYDRESHQILFGGNTGTVSGETWLLTKSGWETAETEMPPPAREESGLAVISSGDRAVLFGGTVRTEVFHDTWEWDGAVWSEVVTDTHPGARFDHGLCRGIFEGSVMLFGGTDGQDEMADTWVYDGLTWTDVTEPTDPRGRQGHGMVHDPVTNTVVLFGGEREGEFQADLWVYNSSGWRQITEEPGDPWPEARADFAMAAASDGCSGSDTHIVMFGGSGRSGDLNDTWVWNGSEWREMVVTGPSARHGAVMTDAGCFGATEVSLVLFGGEDTSVLDDTWIWDGQAWEIVATDDSPSGRAGHVMAGLCFQNTNQASGFVYDRRGRRIRDSRCGYEYDGMDRLVRITDAESREVIQEPMYDGTGKRVRTDALSGPNPRYWLYMGESPQLQVHPDGSYTMNVYAEGRLMARAAFESPDSEPVITYVHSDHLGSMVAMSGSEGQKVWPPGSVEKIQRYHPYGEAILDATADGEPLPGFTGKIYDSESGQTYFNARYYSGNSSISTDPNQFLSPDPIYGRATDPLSWNRYGYCQSNPVNYTDPTGMWDIGRNQKIHQYLTRQAIKDANMKYPGMLSSGVTDEIIRGSWKADVLNIRESHFGEYLFWHSTTPPGYENDPEGIKKLMLDQAEIWYSADDGGFSFGRLIHMIQDSYCPSHVKRDYFGEITAFYVYDLQEPYLHFTDDIFVKNGEKFIVPKEAYSAAKASSEILQLWNNQIPWHHVRDYLSESIWKLTDDVTASTPGEKYKKIRDIINDSYE